tara:strand:+ start:478 stop:1104 length:627 start_codon:yes stop_codon:yes gene_type:complete
MNFQLIGTEYGGWLLDLDWVPENSTIISAGVGEDISFDTYLINNKNCNIIGIDPTLKSHRFIESQEDLQNFVLIKSALTATDNDVITLYKNKNDDHVSESILQNHRSVLPYDSYQSTTISLPSVFAAYDNISVVKMDIEGAEYEVLESLTEIPDSVRQFCVEFHHFCSDKTIEDTKKAMKILDSFGFSKFAATPRAAAMIDELTFWRE